LTLVTRDQLDNAKISPDPDMSEWEIFLAQYGEIART
jgi:hypothetical protein